MVTAKNISGFQVMVVRNDTCDRNRRQGHGRNLKYHDFYFWLSCFSIRVLASPMGGWFHSILSDWVYASSAPL